MKILLAGPSETSALRASLGLRLEGAPPGTAQTPIAPLAAALRRREVAVHVVLTDPSIVDPVRIEEDNCTIEYIPLRAAPRYRARVRSRDLFEVEIKALQAAYEAAAPDLIHAHWTYEYAEAAVRCELPHIVTMHDVGWQNVALYRDLYRTVRLVMMLRVMPRIRHLTVVAPFMRTWARLHGYLGAIDVIPNGVELPKTVHSDRDLFGRRPVRLVSIGDMTRRKNIAASVAAFRLVREKFLDAELHLFGTGLDEGYSRGEPGVVTHGKVPHSDLMEFLANKATLLVHPSQQETFGVIIAEAIARGVPVIAGKNAGGVSYVTDDGAAATLVDVSSPHEISAAALNLLTDRQTFEAFRQVGLERVASRFGIDEIAQLYIEIYSRVLGQHSSLKFGRA